MQQSVLILDDSPHWPRLLTPPLRDAGFAVTTVPDTASALAALHQASPALVLLSAMRDPEGAVASCQTIRRTSRVPIIVLSARADDMTLVHALDAGADDFLGMPFAPRELIARIRAVLRPFCDPLATGGVMQPSAA